MENPNVTLRLQCDPLEGLRLVAYVTDTDGLLVEFVDVPADGEVNLLWSQATK